MPIFLEVFDRTDAEFCQSVFKFIWKQSYDLFLLDPIAWRIVFIDFLMLNQIRIQGKNSPKSWCPSFLNFFNIY